MCTDYISLKAFRNITINGQEHVYNQHDTLIQCCFDVCLSATLDQELTNQVQHLAFDESSPTNSITSNSGHAFVLFWLNVGTASQTVATGETICLKEQMCKYYCGDTEFMYPVNVGHMQFIENEHVFRSSIMFYFGFPSGHTVLISCGKLRTSHIILK